MFAVLFAIFLGLNINSADAQTIYLKNKSSFFAFSGENQKPEYIQASAKGFIKGYYLVKNEDRQRFELRNINGDVAFSHPIQQDGKSFEASLGCGSLVRIDEVSPVLQIGPQKFFNETKFIDPVSGHVLLSLKKVALQTIIIDLSFLKNRGLMPHFFQFLV